MAADEGERSPLSLMRVMSAIGSRLGFANQAGLTFGGKRDLYATLGYQRTISLQDYRDRYERNGVATRVVDTYPKATWRSGGELLEDEDPDTTTEFEAAWRELDDRLALWPAFRIADILAGLGEYSVLILGVKGGTLADPLPDRFSAEDLLYVAPHSQEDVELTSVVTDPGDPRFGQPDTYTLSRIGTPRHADTIKKRPSKTTQLVHWSRLIHVAENLLDDKVYGRPRLRNVWNYLDDLDKVAGGGAEAFWLRAHQGMAAKLDPDLKVSSEDLAKLKEQVEEFAHQMRRTVGLRGVELQAMGSDVADYGPSVDASLKLISVSTGIPVRILTGSERGELASSQDKTNFDDRVADRRTEYAEPVVVRPFTDRLIDHGALPQPASDAPRARNGYRLVWPDVDTLDESEKASVAVKLSSVNRNQGMTTVTPDEIRKVLGLAPLSEVDLDDGDGLDIKGAELDDDENEITDEELEALMQLAEAGDEAAQALLERGAISKKKQGGETLQ
jgi:hypothetical protein